MLCRRESFLSHSSTINYSDRYRQSNCNADMKGRKKEKNQNEYVNSVGFECRRE